MLSTDRVTVTRSRVGAPSMAGVTVVELTPLANPLAFE